MALEYHVGAFTHPAATGNRSYTGVGFQPKVVLFFCNQNRNLNSTDITVGYSIGVGISSTSRGCLSVWGAGATGTFNGGERIHNDRCLVGTGNTGSTQSSVDFVSMDADGFTVNWTQRNSTWDLQGFYIALGGDDLIDVDLAAYDCPASTGPQAYTGVGFQPTALFAFGTDIITTPPTGSNSDPIGCFGAGPVAAISSSFTRSRSKGSTRLSTDDSAKRVRCFTRRSMQGPQESRRV